MNDWYSLVDKGGVVSLALFGIFAFVKGWIVPGAVITAKDAEIARERTRADKWEEMAMRGTRLAEAASLAASEKQAQKERLIEQSRVVDEARARGEID